MALGRKHHQPVVQKWFRPALAVVGRRRVVRVQTPLKQQERVEQALPAAALRQPVVQAARLVALALALATWVRPER